MIKNNTKQAINKSIWNVMSCDELTITKGYALYVKFSITYHYSLAERKDF